MKISPEKEKPLPQRKQIRLTGYDYSLPGYYYVTVCTQERKNILGKIVKEEMGLNSIGRMINQCWRKLPEKFINISLDEYLIMPNHIHGIVAINENGQTHGSIVGAGSSRQNPILGQIVGYFKYQSTKQINNIINGRENRAPTEEYVVQKMWQRGFYEHIIGNETELAKIQEYINLNPLMWLKDENNLKENPV